MTLKDLHERGFRLLAETRRPLDERGIDGVIILNQSRVAKDGSNGAKYFTAAHYAKQNTYGEPVALPKT